MGFEQTTAQEVLHCWTLLLGRDARPQTEPSPKIEIHPGGIEFEADLFVGLQLNFFLKTANRILVRLAEFRVRDFPKFYQKMKSLPWSDYFEHGRVEFEIAAQKSRLNNEKRLGEISAEILSEHFGKQLGSETCGAVYIRMFDDVCTVSVDSTGEHLHKRGWSTLKGEAPLRETIAAFILLKMLNSGRESKSNTITLIDPMVGSGTFLTEARAIGFGQFSGPVAFQKWKKAPKLFLSSSFSFNYKLPLEAKFQKFLGFDISDKMAAIAQKNFEEVERQVQMHQKKEFVKADVRFVTENSLDLVDWPHEKNWLIVNPPYGERLDNSLSLQKLTTQYCHIFCPEKMGVIFPETQKIQKAPANYSVLEEIKINNGGIRCLLTILQRSL